MRELLLILTIIIFTGCEVKKLSTPIQTYTISYNEIKPKESKREDILKVSLPLSSKVIMSDTILYSDANNTLNSYTFNKWIDTPNMLLQKLFIESINDSNLFKSAISDYSRIRANLELESNIIEFKQVFEDKISYGILKVRFYLIEMRTKNLIDSKDFEYKIKSNSNDAIGAVESLNIAVDNLIQDLIKWLNQSYK